MSERHAWDRHPSESPPAFEAFALYRDMGLSRSAGKVAKQLGKSTTIIERWCTGHSWVARAAVWDEELDRVAQAEAQQAIRDMSKRHAQLAVAMQTKAAQALQTLDASTLNASQIARLVRDSVRVERLARGEPTSIDEVRDEEETAERLAQRLRDYHARLSESKETLSTNGSAE